MDHNSLLVGCIYHSPSSDALQGTIGLCNLLTEVDHTHSGVDLGIQSGGGANRDFCKVTTSRNN